MAEKVAAAWLRTISRDASNDTLVSCLKYVLSDSRDAVTILGDDPLSTTFVRCRGSWTAYCERVFEGKHLLDALSLASSAKRIASQ